MIKKYKFGILSMIVFFAIISIFSYFKSERVYTLKEYDSKGILIGTNEYIIKNGDTIMHGKFINYNEKGVKISEGQFLNNEVNGKCFYYYDNGRLKSIHYRKDSKINLESLEYYSNGKEKRYTLYDDFGRDFFQINYDSLGNIKSNIGPPMIEYYQFKFLHKEQFNKISNQKLKIGDILKCKYIVANIPNAKLSFKIENISIDNSKVKRTQKYIAPAQIDVEEVLTKKGKNTIRSVLKYEFNDKITPAFIDTLSFDVNVN